MLSSLACGNGQGSSLADPERVTGVSEVIDVVASEYKIVYDVKDSNAIVTMSELQNAISGATGYKPASMSSGSPAYEYEIQFGLESGRPEAEAVYKETAAYAADGRGAYIIRAVGKAIVVSASDKDSLKLAANELAAYAENGKLLVPADVNKVAVYDAEAYRKSGKAELLDADKIGSDCSIESIKVDGESVLGFSADKTELAAAVKSVSDAVFEIIAAESGADVSVEKNGNTVKITVKSINGKKEKVLMVELYEEIKSEVVNKGGADATVTYVIDDGDQATASFVVNEMAPKYPSLSASFAIVTNKLATLDIVKGEDGVLEYAKDENGFYTYTKKDSVWSFWENVAKNKSFELVSHSYSHKYWGENDNGGTFDYYNTAGEKFTSESMPRGSVSKEFVASKQIIQDLDPSQRAVAFVRTGLSAGGKNVAYSDTFWDPIITSGAYVGARGTYTYPDTPEKMVNEFSNIMVDKDKLKSYMVQHYNTNKAQKTTQADSGPAECLAAGIPYWTDYIDTAVEMKGWAAFCIHTIRPDDYDTRSGHYIFESQADALFAYSENLAKENKVWVATLSEGMLYAIEWASARSEAYVKDGKLVVAVDDEAEGSDFNLALTVKAELPAGKTSAALNGKALKTVSENGKIYVLVDVVPGTSVSVDVK